ncbi:SRPBCC domain-containing protein [Massilia violaceinigra]|uniref:SRPBCC domain-containing protein n=1 Tax=Massilia violaceinigra TaxID=2045208 RepID=A0ABY4A1M7_9BURK|nr:SRPBCC domain-containing protein [Massilia violaceinigra]UOD28652.1 SRPBCC domain-containing protein [Massilia violaceinigra]
MTSPDSAVDFHLTRVFDAPRDLVFKTMTETGHLQKWWGPQGCTIKVIRHEARAGGVFHYCMSFGPGVEMYGRFDYREISAPERLVFVNGFADAEGKRISYAMSPTWPLEVLNTVTLTEDAGQTTLTLVSTPINAGEIGIETFKSGHASMQQGFGGMYDVYAQYLATVRAAQS